jgi:hypothetical protein
MDEGSELSDVLKNFLVLVLLSSNNDEENFARWLQPWNGEFAHPLFLGAFPCSNTAPTPLLPCILLFNLDSFSSPVGDATSLLALGTAGFPATYARLKYFFHKLPRTRLRNPEWKLETCYVKSRPASQLPPPQHGTSRALHDEFWIWRTPAPDIPSWSLGIVDWDEDGMETHQYLRMDATETFPGCAIFVATRPGHYWFGHDVEPPILDPPVGPIVGGTYQDSWPRHMNLLSSTQEGEHFRVMDLSSMWVETMRESGPICEAQVDFGTKSLLITLCVEKSDGLACYKVYLAIGERRDRPREQVPAILRSVNLAEGGTSTALTHDIPYWRAAVTTRLGSVSDRE